MRVLGELGIVLSSLLRSPETTPGISLLLVPGAHTRYQNIGSRGAVASHCLGPHFNGSGMRVSYIFYPQQEVISCLQNGTSQGKA